MPPIGHKMSTNIYQVWHQNVHQFVKQLWRKHHHHVVNIFVNMDWKQWGGGKVGLPPLVLINVSKLKTMRRRKDGRERRVALPLMTLGMQFKHCAAPYNWKFPYKFLCIWRFQTLQIRLQFAIQVFCIALQLKLSNIISYKYKRWKPFPSVESPALALKALR